jgi:hypothetical protein
MFSSRIFIASGSISKQKTFLVIRKKILKFTSPQKSWLPIQASQCQLQNQQLAFLPKNLFPSQVRADQRCMNELLGLTFIAVKI